MKRRALHIVPLAVLFAAVLGLAACRTAPQEQAYSFTRFAMDTVVEYTIVADSPGAAQEAMLAAHAEVERVARLLWEDDSLSAIYRLNHAAGPVVLDDEARGFLERTRAYYDQSGGAFDATIKPELDLYDFTSESAVPPTDAAIGKRLPLVGMRQVALSGEAVDKRRGVAVAVGGVAKGYAVDRAVAVLKQHGIRSAIVNAGGDLYCLGTRDGQPWHIGIRHPDDPDALIDTLAVADAAVATSGDYQHYFDYDGVRYHHLLDPRTGKPAREARSATVLAATTEQADAFATALFVAGPDRGLALLDTLPDIEGLLVDRQGDLHASAGYPSP